MARHALGVGAFGLAAVLVAAAGVAHAQPSPTDAAARDAFDEGTRLYAEGRYTDAARAYEHAYELSPRPLILKNIATAYERALEMGRAADALSRYLDAAHPPDEAELRVRLTRLREMSAATAAGTPQPAGTPLAPPAEPVREYEPEPTTPPPPEPAPTHIDIVEHHNPPVETTPSPARTAPPRTAQRTAGERADVGVDSGGGGVSAAGVVSVVSGVVSVVFTAIGIGTGIAAIGTGAAVTNCIDDVCPGSAAEDIESARSLADASTVTGSIGATLGVAALVLAIIAATTSHGQPPEDSRRSALEVVPGPGGATLGLRF